jgi:hypothetical protein
MFHLYGVVTIAGEGLQKFGLCLALKVFELERVFIVPHLLVTWVFGFTASSKGQPRLITSYNT